MSNNFVATDYSVDPSRLLLIQPLFDVAGILVMDDRPAEVDRLIAVFLERSAP